MPANCIAATGIGLWARRTANSYTICSNVGSNTYPAAFALAKQIGHLRLQRFVRSMLHSEVAEEWRLHRPHSYGHTLASTICGFSSPTPTKAQSAALRYTSTPDKAP